MNYVIYLRIVGWEDQYFYLNTLPEYPVLGGISLTIPFNIDNYPDRDQSEFVPSLLGWCTG